MNADTSNEDIQRQLVYTSLVKLIDPIENLTKRIREQVVNTFILIKWKLPDDNTSKSVIVKESYIAIDKEHCKIN